MAEPFDPMEHARAVSAENLRLRDLLALVAQDLERIACQERYAAHTGPLSERAMRIRRYLHEGPGGNRSAVSR